MACVYRLIEEIVRILLCVMLWLSYLLRRLIDGTLFLLRLLDFCLYNFSNWLDLLSKVSLNWAGLFSSRCIDMRSSLHLQSIVLHI